MAFYRLIMKNLSRMAAICFSWAAAAPAVAQSFPAIQQDGTMTAQGMMNLHACVQETMRGGGSGLSVEVFGQSRTIDGIAIPNIPWEPRRPFVTRVCVWPKDAPNQVGCVLVDQKSGNRLPEGHFFGDVASSLVPKIVWCTNQKLVVSTPQ